MKEPKVIKLDDGGNQLTFKIYPFPATKSEDLMIRIALMTGKTSILRAKWDTET